MRSALAGCSGTSAVCCPCRDRQMQHAAPLVNVANVEQTHGCAEAIHCIAEAEVVLHLQLRKADIDAVHKGHDVAEKQKRNDVPRDFLERQVIGRDRRDLPNGLATGGILHVSLHMRCPPDWSRASTRRPCAFML